MEKALNALSVGQVDMLDTDQLKQNKVNLMDPLATICNLHILSYTWWLEHLLVFGSTERNRKVPNNILGCNSQ